MMRLVNPLSACSPAPNDVRRHRDNEASSLLTAVLVLLTLSPAYAIHGFPAPPVEGTCDERLVNFFYTCSHTELTKPWIYLRDDLPHTARESWAATLDPKPAAHLAGRRERIHNIIESFGQGALQREHRVHQYLDRIDESTWFAEEEDREKFMNFRAKVKLGTYEEPAQPRCGTIFKDGEGKRVALILRGMAYRLGPPSTSYQNRSLDNYFEYIIRPLQDLGYQVDVFLTFYRSEDFDYNTHWKELEERLQPKMITVMSWEDSKQAHANMVSFTAFNMYCLAVQRVYNLVVATRYDLLFKTRITDLPGLRFDKFNYLWKEIPSSFRSEPNFKGWPEGFTSRHHRPDTMHVMHGALLPCLQHAYGQSFLRDNQNLMHYIDKYMNEIIGEELITELVPGYFDSNPRALANPIYDFQRYASLKDLADPPWTDQCNRFEDFMYDATSDSLCCPWGDNCCPITVVDCKNATNAIRPAKRQCTAKPLDETIVGGASPADYVTCEPAPAT
uniref:Uncharacterized protein n=1 Tax=Pyramimonas obovata TaxID=1411642 RepID=A0A7S0N5H9_9CHLO|mmetsp:Transcript_21207/g.46521  ORF Transcript_21207/g.46521 Transcript_21207/m.46521 type:complete len:503 (+) Transcript_21207:228-1736(+)